MSVFLGWESAIARGVSMTLLVAFISLIFGLLLGVSVASAKLSRRRMMRLMGDTYTTVIRGTPELLIIFFAYFGCSIGLSSLASLIMQQEINIEVPSLVASVFALSLIFGGYAAESIRGAMQALPKGQIEAAYAFGFSPFHCFVYIKLPLIWRYALPALGNNWVSLIKSTSLISIVGLEELMQVSKTAAGKSGQHFHFYAIAAVIYLVLTLINVIILEYLERRSRRGERTA